MDFRSDSVAAVAERVRSGEQPAREVVETALARIDAVDGVINAFTSIDSERALFAADAIDAAVRDGRDPGTLAGVPIGVKDLEPAEGFVTSFGSAGRVDDAPADADSVLVGRLRSAGAIIVGKTNTPEYGHKGATDNVPFGATHNPWNIDYSPGGSSGGTAAAVAAGMIPLGTGSDGGGSIRIPASMCGLTGLKAETGRVPIVGRAMPGSGLLSCNGPMGRTAMDSAVALDAVSGHDGRDPLSHVAPVVSFVESVERAEPPTRVIWCPTFGFAELDSQTLGVCSSAVDALAAAGTEVIEIDSVWDEDPVQQWLVLWVVSRFKSQGNLMGTPAWDQLSDSIRPQIEAGAKRSGEQYARAQDYAFELNWKLEEAFETAPYILCPTNAGLVPRMGHDGTINGVDTPGWVQLTMGLNMTRNPAGSVCAGLNTEGLPVGLQVIGRHHEDPAVLGVMKSLEDVIGFSDTAPT